MRSKRVRDFIIFFILVLVTNNSNNDIRNTTLLDNLGDGGPLINEPGGKVPPLTQLRSLNVVHDVGLPALEYLSSLPPPDLLVPSVGAVALLFS